MLVCRNMSALLGISMPLMWRGACDDPDWGVGCRLVCGEMAKDTLDKEAQSSSKKSFRDLLVGFLESVEKTTDRRIRSRLRFNKML
ncbi:mitochondrial inner membrane protein OXA1-like [Musa troglodytarum]|uniref:Mitochondrial inner membrane protein OXA1-like n=1 Tax=Musa troglodytarum TaxID=320322 RepID=A0A9E7KU66_9LILI|nr:mitochondrial inner membrane protein OXA1-like [Musa troglodytarum]